MRSTLRLLASAKSAHLTPYAPTGLAGLDTHPSPRAALHTLYDKTLNGLQQLPESSVYRQSCEAITLRRLQSVLHTKPAGYDEWNERVKSILESTEKKRHPEVEFRPQKFEAMKRADGSYDIPPKKEELTSERDVKKEPPWHEGGVQSEEYAQAKLDAMQEEEGESFISERYGNIEDVKGYESEPPLTTEQVSEIEQNIGAGLIEEVIQVAEGELKLVDAMVKSKVWEPLVEKTPEGQWQYFERRDTHVQ
ncbi:MAG: hypothetical protein Q9160_007796 [Pyrenula sp. 1 TL-2023]